MSAPYKIGWRHVRSGESGEHTQYARSNGEARYLFYRSEAGSPPGTLIVDCELDVPRAETDVVVYYAYCCRQRFRNAERVTREVRKFIGKVFIHPDTVRAGLADIGVNI